MNMAQAIKKCALDAYDALLPCDVVFGEVVSEEPIRVRVGELLLNEDVLRICNSLLYKEATITFSVYERCVVINEGIKEGDILVMVRKSGGGDYVAVGKL